MGSSRRTHRRWPRIPRFTRPSVQGVPHVRACRRNSRLAPVRLLDAKCRNHRGRVLCRELPYFRTAGISGHRPSGCLVTRCLEGAWASLPDGGVEGWWTSFGPFQRHLSKTPVVPCPHRRSTPCSQGCRVGLQGPCRVQSSEVSDAKGNAERFRSGLLEIGGLQDESNSAPVAVTTTLSSMRTPPNSGAYTPGSTLVTIPSVSGSSAPGASNGTAS